MPRPSMSPFAGERVLRYVGDRLRFSLLMEGATDGWRCLLRTNLGRADAARNEMIATLGGARTFAGLTWRDIPLIRDRDGWVLDLPLTEVGWFRAKPYAVDPAGVQHWPDGDDVGISVHPDHYRTANTIYCAFVRMFGPGKESRGTRVGQLDDQFAALDKHGYTIIPPSGKLRDLAREIPHIVSTLGCRILHLLPVCATPTTYARFGRFGSPYAAQDLTEIDPALAVFDQRTTVVDQFREVTYAAHLRGARVFLDVVVNHTGWGSRLQNAHPEFFKRHADGTFHSPGAWGNTWADLVELDNRFPALWEEFAESFLVWCRRGVDGFRCDAGYMVPKEAWQYITARVRQEFPDAVFLLEGLGGAWDATVGLLTEGGMQWAYSELFQNHSGSEVSSYLDHCIAQGQRLGVLVHYSETHDNDRLAKQGRPWSLFRNRLSALTCQSGAYGFTCGVEWLATEKLEVHQARGMNWGATDNLVDELAQVTRLVADHPCFLDGAVLERVSAPDSPVLALTRTSAEGLDRVLVLANSDTAKTRSVSMSEATYVSLGEPVVDLLGQRFPAMTRPGDGTVVFSIPALGAFCLAAQGEAIGLSGEAYRWTRAQSAWAYTCLREMVNDEALGPCDWRALAAWVKADPVRFLSAISRLDHDQARMGLLEALQSACEIQDLPAVVRWGLSDLGRVLPVPPDHWLLIRDKVPFSASLLQGTNQRHVRSLLVDEGHVACFPPSDASGDATVMLERFTDEGRQASGTLRFLAEKPNATPTRPQDGVALLTNGIGGMARMAVALGSIHSKYDCLLGANLHPSAPSDRQVLAKRARVWVNADGFITPVDADNLAAFEDGPPASWNFVAAAGDGQTVQIVLEADMLEGSNTTVLRFSRPMGPPAWGQDLPDHCDVRLIVRVDIEDRSFHAETTRSPGADAHFREHTRPLDGRAGFAFAPAEDRSLRVWADHGRYIHEAEWCEGIGHPVEATRGMAGSGDAFSPGWFELPLARGANVTLVATADRDDPAAAAIEQFATARTKHNIAAIERSGIPSSDPFGLDLALAAHAYLVRRDAGRTVIAGYPWFLDWGRDTFIVARGLLAIGLGDEVARILAVFGRFEDRGTLPNMLNGDDAGNRDTSDAPLWYAVVCEDLAALIGDTAYETRVDDAGRTLKDVLRSIAVGYLAGTPNGIRVDQPSALVWSPPHFTWMDTNYPAGTPREGYPIEIQVLWIRLLRQLERLRVEEHQEPWWALADRATNALSRFWLEDRGYFADVLIAGPGIPALKAVPDNALRSNYLFAVSLGVVTGERARRCVAAAQRFLVVPGALRSLAPLPVS
ncbi:MAG: glycogen debranching enzyme N-terminal domain-containing protein, partial [Planctomycetes bacterium]|nr:glycogen debranching enzyme N-terminal domain-containing protein [Planctomycetota bacterium]